MIRTGLIAILVCTAPVAAQVTGPGTARCGNYGEPAADMPPEFDQFAFIIGDYDVDFRRWDAEAGEWGEVQYTGRWNGYYSLGGRAIVDEWFDPGFGYRPQSGAGLNLRMYDPEAGLWKTAWNYTGSIQVSELYQEMREDGYLYLWQVYPDAAERDVHFETFGPDHWARIERRRDPETGEWTNRVMLEAHRAACDAGDMP